jgi:hypothetical protein
LGDKTMAQLSEKDLLWQYNTASNSIGVMMKHPWRNMLSRWTNFLTEDREKDWRKRDHEFEVKRKTKAEIISKWKEG